MVPQGHYNESKELLKEKALLTFTVDFIKKESEPFPRTNWQASSLVPHCGVLPARFSAGVAKIPYY